MRDTLHKDSAWLHAEEDINVLLTCVIRVMCPASKATPTAFAPASPLALAHISHLPPTLRDRRRRGSGAALRSPDHAR